MENIQRKLKQFLAGNLAGWAGVTVSQPLDYLKIQLQVNYKLPSFRKIFSEIGPLGFYKGASSVYLTLGLIVFIQYTIFEAVLERVNKFQNLPIHTYNLWSSICAGAAVGIVGPFIYCPVEYSKIVSQVSKDKSMGSARRIITILHKQRLKGVKKLMTGIQWVILRELPGCPIYYTSYTVLLANLFNETRHQSSPISNLLSGGLAGVFYQLYVYPIDVIKANIHAGKRTFSELIKDRYWKAKSFKYGMLMSMSKSFVSDGTNWLTYEKTRKFFSLSVAH